MSAFHYLPDSYPSQLFDNRRREGGLYPHLVEVLSNMGKSALCNTNFNSDFFRRARVDNWSNNYGYHDASNVEFSANVFGEIVGEQHGTLLGPSGNHFPGRQDEELRPILDSSNVKPVIVVAKPSLCDEVLEDLFRDQIVVFNDLRRADQMQEEEDKEEFDVKEIIRYTDDSSEPSLIALHGQLLYTVERESSNNAKSQSRFMAKRRSNGSPAHRREAKPAAVDSTVVREMDVRHGRSLEEHELPGPEAVRVGAKYSPWVLPGYGGPKFQQRTAKVVQPEWRDGPGHLIAPWNTWHVLRPGTVIMATIVINVFVMPATVKGKPRRKTYQAFVKSLRVLGRSDVPVERPYAEFESLSEPQRSFTQQSDGSDSASAALRGLGFLESVEEHDDPLTEVSSTASSSAAVESSGREVDGAIGVSDHIIAKEGSDVVDHDRQPAQEFLEDTEAQFVSNTRDGRKGKRPRRN